MLTNESLRLLTRKIDLVFGAIVLYTTRSLPSGRLGAVKQEWHMFVERSLGSLANANIST